MSWLVIYTKPRQELRAQENLKFLGLDALFPLRPIEKIRSGAISVGFEPLFPRYIFVRNDLELFQKVSHAVRNTRGVSKVLKFGGKFAELDEKTFKQMLDFEKVLSVNPVKAYEQGDNVVFSHGAFRNIQAVYQEPEGDRRVILLFDLLNKPVMLSVPVSAVKRI
ncbi:MAG: transcription/translation regulatory transformer protein RfaH [Proteobacteria bacterium]|nr:transcription/translation regulatory transformer protein RfaH [Pseudomonadota bacterium]